MMPLVRKLESRVEKAAAGRDRRLMIALAVSAGAHLALFALAPSFVRGARTADATDAEDLNVVNVEVAPPSDRALAVNFRLHEAIANPPEAKPAEAKPAVPKSLVKPTPPPPRRREPDPAKPLLRLSRSDSPSPVSPADASRPAEGAASRPAGAPPAPDPNPSVASANPASGGDLKTGSMSDRGDALASGGGSNPLGSVPNPDGGSGAGSGSGPGSGNGGKAATGAGTGVVGGHGDGNGSGNGHGDGSNGSGGDGGAAKPAPKPVAPDPPKKTEPDAPKPGDRQEPELAQDAAPEYPESAREDGATGSVTLAYTVSGEGRVEDVRVTKSSGDRRLDRAATDAARKWRYKPAILDGQPRPVKWRRVLRFDLK